MEHRKDQVLRIFREALPVPPAQRASFLEQACGGDLSIRVMVESMLNQYMARKLALDGADADPGATRIDDGTTSADPLIGKRIGDFRVRRHIDSGGMGSVYEAVQDKPRRVVALKVMLRGVASKSALRRLEFEAQLLGRLNHPGIAKVYQAGTFDDGFGEVPYFAMEYIPNARSLTEFADSSHLSTRSRLELFVKVCDAVHHGHQKGIIHRDLKPSNILVDATRQPRIIDFGVARSTDSDMAITTLQTEVGQLIGTLQYMSPEQCDADPHDIDTRSDIYSLGVILYELLCNRSPYDVGNVAIHDAARIIRETAPAKPSSLDHMLRGDIETILLKALEKDRNLRYQSAHDLALDITHHLRNEEIEARRPGALVQLSRFARRHRRLSLAAVVLFATLLGTTAISIPWAVNAARARVTAEEALQDADKLMEIVVAERNEAIEKVHAYEILAANEAQQHGNMDALRAHLDATPLEYREKWEYLYLLRRLEYPTRTISFDARVVAVTVSDDGRRVAAGLADGSARLWDVEAQGELPLPESEESVRCTALSGDGRFVASGFESGDFRIWRVPEGTLHHEDWFNGALHFGAFSGDGECTAGATERNVRVWRVQEKSRLGTVRAGQKLVQSVALSYDGTRVAVGYDTGLVEVWDLSGPREELLDAASLHSGRVNAVAFNQEGSLLASGSGDRTIQVWNLTTGRYDAMPMEHAGGIRAIAFNSDGTRLASASDDHTVRIWDVKSGVWLMTLREHEDVVTSVAFSRTGDTLVSGSWDRTVRVWDTW